jgi:thiol-disulfide isomerase/thioredoxin
MAGQFPMCQRTLKNEVIVKRNGMVVLALFLGVGLMVGSGIMALRAHKSASDSAGPAVDGPTVPDAGSADNAATTDASSGAADGLMDLRGKPAPNFTLKTPDGKPVSLADFKGKAVMVNFWATWCPPCKMEMPWLIDLQRKYAAQGFTVIGISEDDPPFTQVDSFTRQIGVNYPIVIADDSTSKAFGGIDYLPASYYIGRDGKVVVETAGLVSKEEIEANIQKILAR